MVATHEMLVFWIVVGVAVLGLLLLGQLLYTRHQRRRQQRLEALVAERTAELVHEHKMVTDQARKLAELDRAKAELYANVSHEFRTPLTLTLGPLADVRDGRYGQLDTQGVRAIEMARANAARVLELINQLLDVARLESGGMKVFASREDLVGFVRFLAARFVPLAERRQVSLQVRTPDDAVWIYFDPDQMDKVVTNLLANAFKFTQKGDAVEVDVAAGEAETTLIVRDTGRGITRASLPKVFDRFYQSGGPRRRKGRPPGTGLGLALTRDLVELHHGTLTVESDKGEGSVFTVRLPNGSAHFRDDQVVDRTAAESTVADMSRERILAVEATLASLDRSEIVEGAPDVGERKTVLVVDDHPDLRAYVRLHLQERYRVVEAADGAGGLAKARQIVPDLVVSDVMMPEMDGFELTRNLKTDPELDWLPVVLLTARAQAEAKLEGLGIGADDYLTKPFDVRELLIRIDNLIAQRQRLRQRFRAEGASAVHAALPEAERDLPFAPIPEAPPREDEDEAFLVRVAAAIDERIDDEDQNADGVARDVAVSRSQLYQRLKDLTGKTPARLILDRRVERGAALLKSDAGNVSEVAYAVGFKSVAHFSRSFKERYGQTPTAFRR